MRKSSRRLEDSRRVTKLKDALEAEQAKSKEYLNQLKYLQADFENYRKRMEKQFLDVAQRSNEKLIVSLLNIIDDLEKAVEVGSTTENVKALSEGVEMVYRKLCAILEQEGLVKIQAIGKPFDPNMHEILVKVPTMNYEEGTVIEEVRKGFTFRGKVVRPSVVKTACRQEKGEQE